MTTEFRRFIQFQLSPHDHKCAVLYMAKITTVYVLNLVHLKIGTIGTNALTTVYVLNLVHLKTGTIRTNALISVIMIQHLIFVSWRFSYLNILAIN